jgi:hypothetical protein
MLDYGHDTVTFDEKWERLPVRAPDPFEGGFDAARGNLYPCEKRRFVRLRCEGRAILDRQSEHFAVYVVDLSRAGVGIISPVQLFPSELVELTTPERQLPLRIVRCTRLGPDCYHCGCRFQRKEETAKEAPRPEHAVRREFRDM